jgi:pimeloyl-[acyl-carrier protein] synthase
MSVQRPDLEVDLAKLAQLGDGIIERFGALRESDPVHWSEASQCWFVTRHQDVLEGYAGKWPLSSHQIPDLLYRLFSPEQLNATIPQTIRTVGLMSVNLDAPAHPRIRALLMKAFSKNVVESLRPFVRHLVAEVLDAAESANSIEFNEGIARKIPGAVILRLLGFSDMYRERLKTWSNAFLTALGSGLPTLERLAEVERCVIEMNEVFETAIELRRQAPKPDLTTELLNASEGSERLSHDELLGQLHVIVIAGHESTTSSLSMGLTALAKHPEQWKLLHEHRNDPLYVLAAVNELMRYSAMSTASFRVASEDFEWHKKQIKKGDPLFLVIGGANRDPRAYSTPEVMDITRNNSQSLTFGPGMHFCVGHLLAKMQLQEFFATLVERFDRVEILEEVFLPQLAFRGLSKLKVRFHRRIP